MIYSPTRLVVSVRRKPVIAEDQLWRLASASSETKRHKATQSDTR